MVRAQLAVASAALALDIGLVVFRCISATSGDISPTALVSLFAVRVVGLFAIILVSARMGLGRWPRLCPRARQASARTPAALTAPVEMSPGMSAGAALAAPPTSSPLLSDAPQCEAVPQGGGDASGGQGGDARAQQLDAAVTAQRDQLQRLARDKVVQTVLLFTGFMGTAAFGMYAAAKLVSMQTTTTEDTLSAIAQAAGLVLMHAEFLLLQSAVNEVSEGEPVMMEAVHEHPLYWTDLEGKGYANCSICRSMVGGTKTTGYLALQCRLCAPSGAKGFAGGFQVCTACYRKSAVMTGSGVAAGAGGAGILRGDKGPKVSERMSVGKYIRRLLVLAPKIGTLTMIVAVAGSQVVSTFIPLVQGNCVTALVSSDAVTFERRMMVFAVLVVASSCFGLANNVATSIIQARMQMQMSMNMFRALLRQDIAFYDNALTGQLTSRLQSDLNNAISPLRTITLTFFANFVMLVTGFSICMNSSWRLTLLALSILMPVVHISKTFSAWASRQNATQYTYVADAQGAAVQGLTNIRTVRAFGGRDIEVERYERQMTKAQRLRLQTAWMQGFSGLLSSLVEFGASFMILYYGGHLALGHSFEVGSIISFTYLWNRLSSAVRNLTDNINQPIRAASAGQRVFEILDLQPDIPEEIGDSLPSDVAEIGVEFQGVRFTYQRRPDIRILQGLDLTVAPGKTTALCGKSGCGKSTVTKLLMRFYDPISGTVLVNGRALKDLHVLNFRAMMGIVSQDTQLFNATVADNITYGMRESTYTMEDIHRAARSANADEFIRALPEGYRTMCGESGHDFSGGQKQRISIARALVRRPRLLLLDEATSALDAENEALVQEALDKMMAEVRGACTILVIAHRLSTIKTADRIVVLHEGEKVEEGTHDELLKIKDGRYATMIARQLHGGKDVEAEEKQGGTDEGSTSSGAAPLDFSKLDASDVMNMTKDQRQRLKEEFRNLPPGEKAKYMHMFRGKP